MCAFCDVRRFAGVQASRPGLVSIVVRIAATCSQWFYTKYKHKSSSNLAPKFPTLHYRSGRTGKSCAAFFFSSGCRTEWHGLYNVRKGGRSERKIRKKCFLWPLSCTATDIFNFLEGSAVRITSSRPAITRLRHFNWGWHDLSLEVAMFWPSGLSTNLVEVLCTFDHYLGQKCTKVLAKYVGRWPMAKEG